MTFKWSICKILIILLIQCQLALLSSWHAAVLLHRLLLMSAVLVLHHTRMIRRAILSIYGHRSRLWLHLYIQTRSYSFNIKIQIFVSCFDIEEGSFHQWQTICHWNSCSFGSTLYFLSASLWVFVKLNCALFQLQQVKLNCILQEKSKDAKL